MKKLLVLMLVLGMASWASAASVSIAGDTTLAVGATKTYTVVMTVGTGESLGGWGLDVILNNGNATAAAWTILSSGRDTSFDLIQDPMHSETYGKYLSAGTMSTVAFDSIMASLTLTGVTNGTTITITAEELDSAFYDSVSNQFYPTMGSLQVSIIPEPMTLVLLGLGGLFLRRRR